MAFFRLFDHFCRSVMITFITGSIYQGHEAFSDRSRGRQCEFIARFTRQLSGMVPV